MNQPKTFFDRAGHFIDKIKRMLDAFINSPFFKFLLSLEETLDKYDEVIGKRLDGYGERLGQTIKIHQKLIFVLLINITVVGYYGGQANASSFNEWWQVILTFPRVYTNFIWATCLAIFLFEAFWVLKWTLRILLIAFVAVKLYKCYCWAKPRVIAFFEED